MFFNSLALEGCVGGWEWWEHFLLDHLCQRTVGVSGKFLPPLVDGGCTAFLVFRMSVAYRPFAVV